MNMYLRADTNAGLSDKEMLAIMDPIEKDIMKHCEARGKDEYVDDVQWGPYGFKIPIRKADPKNPHYVSEIANFHFHYDPDDEEYDAEEQAHVQYDEFIQYWDHSDDEEEEITHEDYIQECIEDEVYEAWRMNKSGQLAEDDVINFVKTRLIGNHYGFELDMDFTIDDIQDAMYDYFWD